MKQKLFSNTARKPEGTYFTTPASQQNSRQQFASQGQIVHPTNFDSEAKPISKNTIYLPATEGVPNRKYLLAYMNAKESEKDKIINLFHKLFKEYQFNKKEDKDLILRHIRKLYPSALYLSGKKIDNLLKAFMANT